jgi:hypothetical protein
MQFDIQTSEIENDFISSISLSDLKIALQVMQSLYDKYESKPLLDVIVSPYTNETIIHFKLDTTAS